MKGADGRFRWFQDSMQTVNGPGGNGTLLRAVMVEITWSKELEGARRHSEDRFHTLFENAGIGIALVNLDGYPVKSNLTLRAMLGYSEDELHSMPFAVLTHLDDRDCDAALSRDLIDGRLNRFEVEKRYLKKDGREVWGHLTASVVKDRQGRTEYVIAMVQDITDQVRAEAALRESEQFNWEVIHGAREGVIVYDREFRYQAWNPFMEELTGVRISQVLGKRPWEVFPHLNRHSREALLKRALAGETVECPDLFHEPGDAVRSVWTSATFCPHYDAGHKIIGVIGLVRDITERKQAELALQESERRLRLFVEHAPAAIAMLDGDMRYLVVSRRWMADFNLGGRDLQGLSHYEVFPEISDDWKEIHRRCLAGAVERCEEDSFPRQDGTMDWVRWEIRPWRRANDEIGGVVIFAEVITNRKKAEEELRKIQTRHQHIARASNTGLWEWELGSNLVYFSPEWKRQLGYTEDELSNGFEEWESRLHPDDRARAVARTEEYLANPVGEFENEFRLRHKDGSYRWILAQGSIQSFENGKPSRMMGSHIDVTERKLAEERIESSEEKFRKAFMTGADAFYITRLKDGNIIEVNDRFTDFFGHARTEAVGKTTVQLGLFINPADRKKFAAEVKSRGYIRNLEFVFQKKNGDPIPVAISANLLETSGEPILLNVARDMTEYHEAKAGLQHSLEQVRALGASLVAVREVERTRVAREIHDQLGQTLTAVKLELKCLVLGMGAGGKRFAKKTASMLKLIDEATDTVRRIATELRPGILDELGLVAAVEWAGEEFEARTGTACRMDVPQGHFAVDVDHSTALFRIFQETLTNVARHAEATKVEVRIAREDGHLILEVRDNGKGIPPRVLAEGKSLGILGMRERATLLGGALDITGHRGTGTMVRVSIPETKYKEAEL